MAQFLLYTVRADGVIATFEICECEGETDARARALALSIEDHTTIAVEAWEAGRLVFTVTRGDTPLNLTLRC